MASRPPCLRVIYLVTGSTNARSNIKKRPKHRRIERGFSHDRDRDGKGGSVPKSDMIVGSGKLSPPLMGTPELSQRGDDRAANIGRVEVWNRRAFGARVYRTND